MNHNQLLNENTELKKQLEDISKELDILKRVIKSLHMFDLEKGVFESLKGKYLDPEMMDIINSIIIGDNNKVTTESQNTPIVGSSKWKIFKYPSDIDMMQIYKIKAKDVNTALNMFIMDLIKTLYELLNKSLTKKNIFLADSKIGLDMRFSNFIKSLGTLQKTTLNDNIDLIEFFETEIPNYNQMNCINELLLIQPFIKPDDHSKILSILNTAHRMTGPIFRSIYEIIRKYYVLRWKIDEILEQKKVINNIDNSQHIIHLNECLLHNTKIKFDIWGEFNGRYTEITNLILLQWVNSATLEEKVIGLELENYELGIVKDLLYYSHPDHLNCVKLTKRIWNRAIYHCNPNNIDPTQYSIIKILYPLFNLDINIISQAKADIELLINALEKKNDLKLSYESFIKHLFDQVDDITYKLFRTITLSNKKFDQLSDLVSKNMKQIFNILIVSAREHNQNIDNYTEITDQIFDSIYMNKGNIQKIIDILNVIDKELKTQQNTIYCNYVNDFKLNPQQEGSIIHLKYTPNYLNLPPVVINK